MFTLNCRGKLLVIKKPMIMGIINVTPDSFFADSRVQNNDSVLRQADTMLLEGADIIDIGGQSTRPGSKSISAAEEMQRILPAIRSNCKNEP